MNSKATSNSFKTLLIATAVAAGASASQASSHSNTQVTKDATKQEISATAVAPNDMADGEIRKIDMETKKITIKHGEIKNLDMPGMTMVFQVKDPALLDKLKVGDKISFKAEKSGGAFVVTGIQPAR